MKCVVSSSFPSCPLFETDRSQKGEEKRKKLKLSPSFRETAERESAPEKANGLSAGGEPLGGWRVSCVCFGGGVEGELRNTCLEVGGGCCSVLYYSTE